MIKYTTRTAPSPTGLFHLGTARTTYINYLAAKASGGKFILRIDDTDVERNKKEYTQVILDSMEWLGLEPDEVFYQSKRSKMYLGEIQGLVNAGKALELSNGAVALRYSSTMPSSFRDSISGSVLITDTNKEQIHERLILLRGIGKDGNKDKFHTPTYQVASVLDDYFLGINWIIRGNDHLSNTPKQVAIWSALNEMYSNSLSPHELPKFTHLGLIFMKESNESKPKKLSKRDGAASLLSYKEQGYSPAAMLNFMLKLGWAPRNDNAEHKFIDKERAIAMFFEGNLKNSPCNYELHKLDNLQKHYKNKT